METQGSHHGSDRGSPSLSSEETLPQSELPPTRRPLSVEKPSSHPSATMQKLLAIFNFLFTVTPVIEIGFLLIAGYQQSVGTFFVGIYFVFLIGKMHALRFSK